MRKQVELIQDVAAKNKWESRKYQYMIISEITGVEPDVCKEICSLQRALRWAFPSDEVGLLKEKEYHATPQLRKF